MSYPNGVVPSDTVFVSGAPLCATPDSDAQDGPQNPESYRTCWWESGAGMTIQPGCFSGPEKQCRGSHRNKAPDVGLAPMRAPAANSPRERLFDDASFQVRRSSRFQRQGGGALQPIQIEIKSDELWFNGEESRILKCLSNDAPFHQIDTFGTLKLNYKKGVSFGDLPWIPVDDMIAAMDELERCIQDAGAPLKIHVDSEWVKLEIVG